MQPWLVRNTPAIGLFVLTLLAWQGAVSFLKLREYLLPSPASVLRALSGAEIPWAGHVWITTVEIVGAFVVAAVVTPPDVLSQFMLALPMCVLYEAGLFLARFINVPSKAQAGDQGQTTVP